MRLVEFEKSNPGEKAIENEYLDKGGRIFTM
jgi:hypothetical protein